jgi:ABC-type sulfate transport system permease component/ABC-type sulfate/molybdate transport systems ATPase subunit
VTDGAASALTTGRRGWGRRPRPGGGTGVLGWLGALLALYLLLPLGGLLGELASGHASTLGASGLSSALTVSLVTATCTTAICALLGVPLAYHLARSRRPVARLVGVVVLLPLALPPLMAGIALVTVVGPDTALGQLFGGRLTDSMAGIVLAQTFVAAPFTVVAARSAFERVDPALEDVAATLGMRRWRRFAQVALPVAGRGIGAGLLLSWLRAFGEFGATVVVAYHPYSLPVLTYVRFGGFGLDQAVVPSVLALAAAAVVLVLTRMRWPRRQRAPAGAPPAPPAPKSGSGPRPIAFWLDEHLGPFHLRLAHEAGRAAHLAILGPSGAGKTTALRCLAGLIGGGRLRLGTTELGGVAVEDRRLGYVPQEAALLPGRSVWHQVNMGEGVEAGRAAFWLERLGLHGLERRLPAELSGGQRHRVALARALARDPELILLDEPFAGLDGPVRHRLCRELRQLLRDGSFASVLVTHDPEEAALLSEEILVIDDGVLLQAGPAAEVFERPASPAVARLLAIDNIQAGRISAPGVVDAGSIAIDAAAASGFAVGAEVLWCVRPELCAVRFAPHDGTGHPSTVLDAVDLGATAELRLGLGEHLELVARTPLDGELATPGAPCTVHLPPEHVRVWQARPEGGGATPAPAPRRSAVTPAPGRPGSPAARP